MMIESMCSPSVIERALVDDLLLASESGDCFGDEGTTSNAGSSRLVAISASYRLNVFWCGLYDCETRILGVSGDFGSDGGCDFDGVTDGGRARPRMFDDGGLVVSATLTAAVSFDRLIWFVMIASMRDAAVSVRCGCSGVFIVSLDSLPE